MRALKLITGHVIHNPAYTYKFQLKTSAVWSPVFFFIAALSCPELPKRPKQKNSCSKMWLIDHLYIKLGPRPRPRWGRRSRPSQLELLCAKASTHHQHQPRRGDATVFDLLDFTRKIVQHKWFWQSLHRIFSWNENVAATVYGLNFELISRKNSCGHGRQLISTETEVMIL